MISYFEQLLPLLRIDLPDCPDPLLLQYVQDTAREFCRKTEAWREKLTYNIVDSPNAYTTAYNAAIANGMSSDAATVAGNNAQITARQYTILPHYDAEVVRLWKVWDVWDGEETNEPIVDPQRYNFEPSTAKLTFRSDLKTYSPTATAWVTLTAYAAGDYVLVSSLRYMCAIAHTSGTWATDLAAYRWQLMPNDLVVRAVLVPRMFCKELAGWFMEKWGEGIIAGTKATLMAMKNKSWSSPERVSFFQDEYTKYVRLALRERFTENKSTGSNFDTPPFVR